MSAAPPDDHLRRPAHPVRASTTMTSTGAELAHPEPAPAVISSYELHGEIGRGGVGVVLRAHDRRLSRDVAIKRLQRIDPRSRIRFDREMRITARQQHPGVVPVHEAGVLPTGEPFYSMRLVDGTSLRDIFRSHPALGDRLRYLPNLLAVAETIAYAHSRRVIHRDLKPANIIVGDFGETVVIDWGLAKELDHIDDDAALTEVRGTPPSAP